MALAENGRGHIEMAYGSMKSLINDKRANMTVVPEDKKKYGSEPMLASHLMALRLIEITNATDNGENVLLEVASEMRPMYIRKKRKVIEEAWQEAAS